MPTNHDEPPRKKGEDVVWIHSAHPDGEAVNVVRKRGEEISLGQMRKAEEGKPLSGELVSLKARDDSPQLFDVEVLYEGGAREGRAHGPAHVSSPAYREGWSEVFGAKRRKRGEALN